MIEELAEILVLCVQTSTDWGGDRSERRPNRKTSSQ